MGVYYSMCCLISRENLINGLQQLALFEFNSKNETLEMGRSIYSPRDEHYYIKNTPIENIVTTLVDPTRFSGTEFLQVDPSVDLRMNESTLLKCNLKQGESIVTVWFTPWTQHIFEITTTGKYFLIVINYLNQKNQSFIPSQHPDLIFISEIIQRLNPVYGWLEGDFTGRPNEYWGADNNYPSLTPPWHQGSNTLIIGEPLSSEVKKGFDFDTSNTGLFYYKNLGGNLYFITQPGKLEERYGPDLKDENVRLHNQAIKQLLSILQNIQVISS
jgi:hypothetical protein